MDAAGVLVSCSVACNSVPRRCSGIRLGRDWVLTTGSILSTVLEDISGENKVASWKSFVDTTNQGRLVRVQDKLLLKSQVTFSVITSHVTSTNDQISFTNNNLGFKEGNCSPTNKQFPTIPLKSGGYVQCNNEKLGSSLSIALEQPLVSSDACGKHEEFKCVLKYIFRSTLVSEAVDTILSSWVLGSTLSNEDDSNVDTESEIAKNLISMFLILKLQTDNDDSSEVNEYDAFVNMLRGMFEPEEEVLKRGQFVVVESTPFGNCYFHNSISQGIISNVLGPGHCLLLTDASTAIGCEGGPISVIKQRDEKLGRRLIGMVLCSISWWRGEWIGFTLGVALQPVVHRLLSDASLSKSLPLMPPDTSSDRLAGVDDCVVLVRCGVSWGSGVTIDCLDGIVLTCSHVVRNARNGGVWIYRKNRRFAASVLFRSRDGLAYDVAVLRVGPGLALSSVNVSSNAAVKGEPVIAAGFSLFSENDNVQPTVTRGIVTHVSNPVAVLQTSCCIQSGASGGALFRCTGDLVGIISCNIMDTSSKALFPRINMAVPASVLAEPLNAFLRTGDMQFLADMESKDPVIQRLWKLQTTVSKL